MPRIDTLPTDESNGLQSRRDRAVVGTVLAAAAIAGGVHTIGNMVSAEDGKPKPAAEAPAYDQLQPAEVKTASEQLTDHALNSARLILQDLRKPNTGVVNHSDEYSIQFGNKTEIVGADGEMDTNDELVPPSAPDMFVRVTKDTGEVTLSSVAFANGENEKDGFYSYSISLKPGAELTLPDEDLGSIDKYLHEENFMVDSFNIGTPDQIDRTVIFTDGAPAIPSEQIPGMSTVISDVVANLGSASTLD